MALVMDVLKNLAGFVTFWSLKIIKAASIKQCFFKIAFLLVVLA